LLRALSATTRRSSMSRQHRHEHHEDNNKHRRASWRELSCGASPETEVSGDAPQLSSLAPLRAARVGGNPARAHQLSGVDDDACAAPRRRRSAAAATHPASMLAWLRTHTAECDAKGAWWAAAARAARASQLRPAAVDWARGLPPHHRCKLGRHPSHRASSRAVYSEASTGVSLFTGRAITRRRRRRLDDGGDDIVKRAARRRAQLRRAAAARARHHPWGLSAGCCARALEFAVASKPTLRRVRHAHSDQTSRASHARARNRAPARPPPAHAHAPSCARADPPTCACPRRTHAWKPLVTPRTLCWHLQTAARLRGLAVPRPHQHVWRLRPAAHPCTRVHEWRGLWRPTRDSKAAWLQAVVPRELRVAQRTRCCTGVPPWPELCHGKRASRTRAAHHPCSQAQVSRCGLPHSQPNKCRACQPAGMLWADRFAHDSITPPPPATRMRSDWPARARSPRARS